MARTPGNGFGTHGQGDRQEEGELDVQRPLLPHASGLGVNGSGYLKFRPRLRVLLSLPCGRLESHMGVSAKSLCQTQTGRGHRLELFLLFMTERCINLLYNLVRAGRPPFYPSPLPSFLPFFLRKGSMCLRLRYVPEDDLELWSFSFPLPTR